MTDDMAGPLDRDPELTRMLQAGFGDTPSTEWRRLEARLTEAARFRLTARRPAGWRVASRWARIAIPVGLAASAVLGAGLAFRASGDEAVVLEDLVATAAVDALPSDVASLGAESLVYALMADGE